MKAVLLGLMVLGGLMMLVAIATPAREAVCTALLRSPGKADIPSLLGITGLGVFLIALEGAKRGRVE